MTDPTAGLPDPMGWFLAIAGLVAALATIHRYVIKPLVRLFQKAEGIVDTFNGEPERDGLPARPGLVARQIATEQALATVGERLGAIEQSIRVNGTGLAIGDAVAQALKQTHSIEAKVDKAASKATEAADLVAVVKAHADEAEAHATSQREAINDRLTHWVEEGQLREAAYLASLIELGIDIKPLPHRPEGPR